jgi:hypothetical protein
MGLEFGETIDTDLSVPAVLEAAATTTGLDDFGPEDFH